MAGSAANLDIWQGADVYAGAIGTAAPIDVTTSLNVAFKAVGLLSNDGLTLAMSEDTTDLTAWGVGVVRTSKRNHKRTFQVTCLEDNLTVFGLVNPGSTSVFATPLTTRTVKAPVANPMAWVFQLTDGAAITKRIYVPRGEVTDVADITYADSSLEAKQLTITVYGAADGTLYQEFTNNVGAGT